MSCHNVDLSLVSSSELAREMSRRSLLGHAARRILRPCRFCTLPFGVRDMRKHLHQCTLNPTRYGPRGVRAILPCRHCGEGVPRGERRNHAKHCALNPHKQFAPCNYCGESLANGSRQAHKVNCAKNPRNMPRKKRVKRGN